MITTSKTVSSPASAVVSVSFHPKVKKPIKDAMLISNFPPSCTLSHSPQDHDVVCIVGRGIFRLSWICLILMGSTFTQSTFLISWFSVFVKDLWKWHPRALRRMCRLIEGVLKSFGFQKVTVHVGGFYQGLLSSLSPQWLSSSSPWLFSPLGTFPPPHPTPIIVRLSVRIFF